MTGSMAEATVRTIKWIGATCLVMIAGNSGCGGGGGQLSLDAIVAPATVGPSAVPDMLDAAKVSPPRDAGQLAQDVTARSADASTSDAANVLDQAARQADALALADGQPSDLPKHGDASYSADLASVADLAEDEAVANDVADPFPEAECLPGTRRCDGTNRRLCSAAGFWDNGVSCPYVCTAGICTGACVPGSSQCSGLIVRTCDSSGSWVNGPSCPYVCAGGQCGGSCTPASKRCSGSVPQTCDANGEWQSATTCPYVCSDGACTGSCLPGSKQCAGNTPQTCSAAGSWADGSACPYACTSGLCAGTCVPGTSSPCGTGGTHACDASGEFEVCQGSGYTITSTCPASSVQMTSDGAILGGAWCFFLVNYPLCEGAACHSDYVLEVDAKLDSGGGYGIWPRGVWTSGTVRGVGVQYDTGAGGIKLVRYPETESSFLFLRRALDTDWHHWRFYGMGSRLQVYLDDQLLLDSPNEPTNGVSFGFRTWWSNVMEIRNLTVVPAE